MERWRIIPMFPAYAVSDYGRVKRAAAGLRHPIRILKPWKHSTGCLCVTLRHNGKRRSVRVHILVASAFIPNPLHLPTVNHKHGDKTKNFVGELEWASSERQIVHAVQTGLHKTKGYGMTTNGRWQAYIVFKGKQHHLGVFTTATKAKAARLNAEKIYHRLENIT